jgi:hypothetical protein
MSADPFVIRSQRNRYRNAASAPLEGASQDERIPDTHEGRKSDLNYGSHLKLQLVSRREHLGYVSTG